MMAKWYAIVVWSALTIHGGCQGNSTMEAVSQASGHDAKGPMVDRRSRKGRPTASDLIALIGGCVVFVICMATVIAWVVYKKRGDRSVKRLEHENDLEESQLDEQDKAFKRNPELIHPRQQEEERKKFLLNHEKQIRGLISPNEELQRCLETEAALCSVDQVVKKASSICKISKDQGLADAVKPMQEALSKADAGLSAATLTTVPQARCPEVKIRRDTRVVAKMPTVWFDEKSPRNDCPLHISDLSDVVQHRVYIGQALGKNQDPREMWRMIWDNEIAVAVWIGNQSPDDKMYFKPYSAISEREETYDSGMVKATLVNKFQMSGHKVIYYETELRHAISNEKREILIFHIEEWPKWNTVNAATTMVDLLGKIQDRLFKPIPTMICETMLHNLLIQCPTGTHQSVTLAIAHLCRQTWLRNDKINVPAVATYVRKHRYHAWNLPPADLLEEVKLVYAVMEKLVGFHAQAKAESRKLCAGKTAVPKAPWEK